MSVKFTEKQLEAIHTINTNILVSAGAGSGKTAVLSERVLEHVKQRCDIDQLLILTFTNAAAKEMKGRIRKKIEASAMKNPKLLTDLAKIDQAHITTFDSFALFILKKYGYLKNISKQISVADNILMNDQKNKTIECLFERYYASNNQAFFNYLDAYVQKDDDVLKAQIIMFADQINLHYDREKLLDNLTDHFYNDEMFEELFKRYEGMLFEMVEAIHDTAKTLFDLSLSEEALEMVNKIYDHLTPLFKVNNYDDLCVVLPALKRMPAFSKKIKEDLDEETIKLIETIKSSITTDQLKKLKLKVQMHKAEHKAAFYASSEHLGIIKTLIESFHQDMVDFQVQHEMFEFSMIARLALDIIYEFDHVRTAIKNSLYEVLIDEYQDTSFMQESFIEAITENNVVMVGDVKQSIYRFRHAEPDLFVEKYYDYQKGHGGHLIDLNLNFRSRKEVLSAINQVFIPTMDETVGGVAYTTQQQLEFGNKSYEAHQDPLQDYGLKVLTIDKLKETELLEVFSTREAEIFVIAHDILNRVKARQMTFDEGTLRPAHFGDFAVLLDRKTNFDLFKQIFEYVGVPLKVHKEEDFVDTEAIAVLRNLLILIDGLHDKDRYQSQFKHAFYSVARSFLLQRDDQDCIEQMLVFEAERYNRETVLPSFEALFDKLEALAYYAKNYPLDEVLFEVLSRFDFYQKITYLEKTDQVKFRLDALLDIGMNLSKEGYLLKAFIDYLEMAKNADQDIQITTNQSTDDEAVHLMTIHKSKGLEFPYVYMGHLEYRFQIASMRNYDFDKSLGFIMKHFNEGLADHFVKDIKALKDKTEDISERLRVLYVALTRAKESLTIILTQDEDKEIHFLRDDEDKVLLRQRKNYRAFNDVFTSVKEQLTLEVIDLKDYPLSKDYEQIRALKKIDSTAPIKQYEAPLFQVTKQSSSQMSHGVNELLDQETLSFIDKGNKLHDYLEMIDFKGDIDAQIKTYTNDKKEEKLLEGFFNHSLIKSLAIVHAYKEFPFIAEKEGETIRGFIDLVLETKDAFYVIDYKLKTIDKDYYTEQVKGYMNIISTFNNKPVKGYLYSIIDQTFKEVRLHD